MSYEPHVWETGEVITAQKLNHMEDSIGAFYVPVTVTMNDQSQPTYSTEVSVYDILDAYNKVAADFAIGTNDISKAMEIASAGMATYGNSFEETIGLVTAGTEIMVGRSSQVARGLNTIAANITQNKDILAKYGIVVEDANGNLKSTYDVLKELKPKWDKMSDAERVALGVTLAG